MLIDIGKVITYIISALEYLISAQEYLISAQEYLISAQERNSISMLLPFQSL